MNPIAISIIALTFSFIALVLSAKNFAEWYFDRYHKGGVINQRRFMLDNKASDRSHKRERI